MSKKLLSIILVLSLIVTLLAACGGNNNGENVNNTNNTKNTDNGGNKDNGGKTPDDSGDKKNNDSGNSADYGDTGGLELPLVDEPTTVTWMLVSNNEANDKLIAKEIEKRTGITVDLQTVPAASYKDKLRVTVASGNLPNIFHGLPSAELKEMGKEGAVVAINDYLDMLPNFKRLYVEENPWVIPSYGDEEGNMYTWPIYNMARDVNFGFMYRADVFEEEGIEPWTDTEGFYSALKQLKEAYPDTYPFAIKKKAALFKDLAYGWDIGGPKYPFFYDEEDSTWKFSTIQPKHKEMLDFLKKLYNEGLIDPEFLTDNQDSWSAKMTTDKAFVTHDWIGRMSLFQNQVKDTNPDFDLRYGHPIGPTPQERPVNKVDAGWGITVANKENKEAALKLLDYLTSPSGAALVTLGVEGETFTFNDEGKPVYPDIEGEADIVKLEDKYGLWLEGMYLNPDRRSVYYSFTEAEQEAQDMIVGDGYDKRAKLDPIISFTDEENETLAELETTLKTEAESFNSKYVLDESFGDEEWQEWLETAKQLGADRVAEIYNAAQKRYDAANN